VIYVVPDGGTVDERFAVLDEVLRIAFDLRVRGEGVEVGVLPSGYVFAVPGSCVRRPLVAA